MNPMLIAGAVLMCQCDGGSGTEFPAPILCVPTWVPVANWGPVGHRQEI